MIGRSIAHYTITAKIGEGGMGEVYRATDSSLKRDVALKFLPESMAQDETARRRFLREARSAAALDHPFICQIFEIGEVEGVDFIAMEYVSGQTLKEKLSEGLLAIPECLRIASEIAEALELAQEKAIVHRDLKPTNIMLTAGGHVKLMDFGLAKRASGAQEDTQQVDVTKLTREGSTLGTVPYMSPEQLKGEQVDSRSDIFSFGIILYEMLAGVHPFIKLDAMATASSILQEEPPPLALHREGVSPLIQYMVRKMLAKELKSRYQLVHELHTDLVALQEDPGSAAVLAGRIQMTGPAKWQSSFSLAVPWTLAILLAVAVGVLWMGSRADHPSRIVRTAIPLSPGQQLIPQFGLPLAISPDGRQLAYTTHEAGTTRLYLRSLDEFDARLVPETDGASYPFFSPEGEWVGYWASGVLYRVLVSGGPPVPIGDATGFYRGAAWGPDQTIIFSSRSGLHRIPATGGEAKPLGGEADPVRGSWPQFLPDGGLLLVVSGGVIVRLDLSTLEFQTLWNPAEPIKQARYLPSGHIAYGSAGDIIVVAFDLDALEVRGAPVPVAQDLHEGATGSGAINFAVSDEGTMVYVNGGIRHSLMLVDRDGVGQLLAPERAAFRYPSFSPDGQQVSVAIDDDPRPTHIWIYDLRGSRERLTSQFHNITSAWAPDGSAIAFSSSGRGAPRNLLNLPYLKSLGGGDEVRPLLPKEFETPHNQFPGSWSPDGKLLVFTEGHPETGTDLWLLDLSSDPVIARELIVTPFDEIDPRVSPDGRWLAYRSNRTGPDQVFVRPFPGEGVDIAISLDGGTEPRWAAETGELFFRNGSLMMVTEVRTGGDFAAGEPRLLFDVDYGAVADVNYDVSPDGQQFVMIKIDPQGQGRRLEIVQGWFEELRRLVPTNP